MSDSDSFDNDDMLFASKANSEVHPSEQDEIQAVMDEIIREQ